MLLSAEEFQGELKKALAGLPADMRKDLLGVPVEAEDLPKADDLTSGEPPLSPTILVHREGGTVRRRGTPKV